MGSIAPPSTGIPVDTIEKMRSACQAAGKICEFVIYPDTASGGSNADYRPSYREGPAWRACLPGSARTVSPKTAG